MLRLKDVSVPGKLLWCTRDGRGMALGLREERGLGSAIRLMESPSLPAVVPPRGISGGMSESCGGPVLSL